MRAFLMFAVLFALIVAGASQGAEPVGASSASGRTLAGGFGSVTKFGSVTTVDSADNTVAALLHDPGVIAAIAAVAGSGDVAAQSYRSQVVNGMNYLIHVHVKGKSFTVKVYKPISNVNPPSVSSVTAGNHVDA